MEKNILKIGDKIKTFEVVDIVEREAPVYNEYGRKKMVLKSFLLLRSVKGEERVLESSKNKLNQAETWITTFGTKRKYKTHEMM